MESFKAFVISIPNERPLGSITCQPSENKSLFSETHHSEMEVAIKGNSGFPCSPSSLKYGRPCEGSGELQALQGGWEVHKKRQGCEERTGFGGCPHGGRNSSRSTVTVMGEHRESPLVTAGKGEVKQPALHKSLL